ncbi:unnamed protein product [Candidula unifasciata]|uniref:Sodium/potassium-transporting ATPase subunit beta n=1 Tax=Candidula unifasciata TaxID=100452 RepID=A0A8S3ZAJ8_9EUPU|nr:unnamed protein product [Candidula unifasciata]
MADNPYGPVTMSDSSHLTDDDWELSLPPIKYRSYPGADKIKSLCNELRDRHTTFTLATTGVCVLFLITMVVITLAVGYNTKRLPADFQLKWHHNYRGLEFYPVPEDKSILIYFAPNDFITSVSHPIRQSLDSVLGNYSTVQQLNETVYTNCNATYSPMDKTCRVSRTMFGDSCTSSRNYGYGGGQPCVFIQLNLPDGVTIRPITKESPLWEAARAVVENVSDPSFLPFTCDGTTQGDRDILTSVDGYGPHGERIMYFPKQGLMSYIYRERKPTHPFLKPGVMVQFTSLVSGHTVRITCTAWGQLYDAENRIIDHTLLSTYFALYVNHE